MDIKPVVGMTVYLRPTAYNHNKDIREGTLTKIGRKYYTVAAPHQEFKFGISCLRMISDYSPDYTLFFSKEQLDSEVERERRNDPWPT